MIYRLTWRRGALLAVAAFLLASPPVPGQPSRRQPSPPRPKLLVLMVVDQMRSDFVDRFQSDWTGGLKRIFAGGARFTNAAYPYLSTYTCAGHATIATGTLPYQHGIVQNAWFDRERAATMACTDDPSGAAVGYSGTPVQGFGPRLLLRPTLADELRSRLSSRVVTIALKPRSAIMLAGHGGDAVLWMNDSSGAWQTSTAFAPAPAPAIKTYFDSHPIADDYGKVWTKSLPAARYPEEDDDESEAPPPGWTRTFPHALVDPSGTPGGRFINLWQRSPFADEYVGRMVVWALDALKLGQRGVTDVLGISFSAPDMVGHAFGPESQELRDMYVRLDRSVGSLLAALDKRLGRDGYTLALSADHGVMRIPERQVRRGLDAGRLPTSKVGDVIREALAGQWGPPASAGSSGYVARVLPNDVYFAPGIYDRLKREPQVLAAVVQAVSSLPGILRVMRAEEVDGAIESTDRFVRGAALSYVRGRSGDLILVMREGWMSAGSGTTHGTGWPDDQRVPMAFYGRNVRPGTVTDPVTPADIAPTLAALAGFSLPQATGRILQAAIANSEARPGR